MPPAQPQAAQAVQRPTVRFLIQMTPLLLGFTAFLYLLLPMSSMTYRFDSGLLTSVWNIFWLIGNIVQLAASAVVYSIQCGLAIVSGFVSFLLFVMDVTFSMVTIFFSIVGEGHRQIGTAISDTCSSMRSSLCLPVIATFYFASVAMFLFFCVHMTMQFFYLFREKYRLLISGPGHHHHVSPHSFAAVNASIGSPLGRLWGSTSDLRQRKPTLGRGQSAADLHSIHSYSSEESLELKNSCVICLSATKSVVLLPCRHLCVCQSCADQLRQHPDCFRRQCPLCRTHICDVISCYI